MKLTFLSTLLLLSATGSLSKLLIDYRGGSPVSSLGNLELEGNALGCKIKEAGNAAYIRPEFDPATNRNSLRYHRDPNFRRAEVKALGTGANAVQAGKTYFIGYEFRLAKSAQSLVIFQWKKHDKEAAPKQNIPLYVFFESPGRLVIEYTIPGTDGSNRDIVWEGPLETGSKVNKLAFAINTAQGGKGWLEFYVNGQKQVFLPKWGGSNRLSNVELFTGPTSPKFGIYRAEATNGDGAFCPSDGIFKGQPEAGGQERSYDSWVYTVQIADGNLGEIKEASGV